MSSDSDSDICDFTSDVGKHMLKGLTQFKQDFNKIIENQETKLERQLITEEENFDLNEKNEERKKKTELIFIEEDNVQSRSLKHNKEETKSEKKDENINEMAVVEELDINAQSRIKNKLNKLSEEIESILNYKRKRTKKQTRRLRQRNKKKNINIPTSNINSSVILSSDDEAVTSISSSTINLIEEELNPIVTVNVLWRSVQKNSFQVYKYQVLNCIPEYYTEKLSINSRLLFFTLDDKPINLENSSFVSLRLHDNKQIEGGILPESYLYDPRYISLPDIDDDPIKFKVQYNNCKNNEITVSCRKDDKMEIIFWKVSRYTKQAVENIRLYMDGCVIKSNNKISEMDLEEGDCFDMEIINSV